MFFSSSVNVVESLTHVYTSRRYLSLRLVPRRSFPDTSLATPRLHAHVVHSYCLSKPFPFRRAAVFAEL